LIDNFNDSVWNPLKIGVTDPCVSAIGRCGLQRLYWHTHDVAHNYFGPTASSGFQTTSSTLPSAEFRDVIPGSGSPYTEIYYNSGVGAKHTAGSHTIIASNTATSANVSTLHIRGIPGPGSKLSVTRTGGSQPDFTTDEAIGFEVKLFDIYTI
jgi:hypothetical protein